MNRSRSGFTLLEILLVVAAIAILAGIVIVAVNPGKQLGETRDAQRRADVNALLNAVYQYSIDTNGSFPASVDGDPNTYQAVGAAASGCSASCGAVTTVSACADLSSALVDRYIVAIPWDPASGDADNTEYYINKTASGRITVGACNPEQADQIEVTR